MECCGEQTLRSKLILSTENFVVADYRCTAGKHSCSHEEFSGTTSVVFVRRGVFIRQIGRTHDLIDSTRAVIFQKDECYRMVHPVDGGDDCTCISISDQVLSEWEPHWKTTKLPRTVPNTLRTFATHNALASAARSGNGLAVEEAALKICASILRDPEGGPRTLGKSAKTRAAHRETVWNAVMLLNSDLQQNWSLGALADACACSPFHLCRIFRSITGQSLHHYQSSLRLRTSLRLLSESDTASGEVGLALGYASPSHFAQSFKATFEMTPTEFRRAMRKRGGEILSELLQQAPADRL